MPPRKPKGDAAADRIDQVQAQWKAVAPELDTSPVGVLGRIYRIAELAGRPIAAAFKAQGLDRGEFDVIGTLMRTGAPHELTPTELYRDLMISSGGLTHRLKRLEDAGLITRIKSDDDGRSSRVRLTEAGRARALAAYAADLQIEAGLLEGLDGAERAQLEALLRKLHGLVAGRMIED
jgi:DNA-binding MarR family transcriptional regulator